MFYFFDPAGTRTQDPLLKRQLLYRLSYRVEYSVYSNIKKFFWQDLGSSIKSQL